ncbi:PHB depolymerase family esterase [Pseudonocardia sp. ICBG1142]|uniref:alpha/beta hydrolase family esterase n=1 Tax=Pseudonocardia sp. ICBG1142 TaxID=2846760 RepID=UPI001CF6D396|nr:poly(3-hydroxybutyrate) depolymerase [Pseudonocardia sp. ICBG1142]
MTRRPRRARLRAVATACLVAAALTTGAAVAPTASGSTPGPGAAPGPVGAPTPGCGTTPPQAAGTTAVRTIDSGGRERSVRVHLPDGYRPDRPTPVVLVFHVRGNDGATTENFSGLSGLPAVVAYPDGVPGGEGKRSWQGAPYSAPGVDDVAFTGDLLDDLESTLCVDPGRVFATGKSNGGGFTEILACRMSDRIAAIAPVAGAYYRAGEPPCRLGRPVPALFVHGTGDATIPYTGDADRGLPAIPAKVAEWVARDGCRARPQTRRIEPDVTIATWRGCRDGARVAHVAVDGGGHTWPGATAYSGGGVTTQTVRATALIGDFFGLGGPR